MFDLILEILLAALGEYLWLRVWRRGLEWFVQSPWPFLVVAAFAFQGGLYGGLSLLFAPRYLIHNPSLRFWYVALMPVVVGLLMAYLGARRTPREQRLFRFDHFVCAYMFTLMFVVIRAAGIQ